MDRIDPDAVAAPAFVLRDEYSSAKVPWHSHRKAQLVAIVSGSVTVVVEEGRWVLTPQQAVWILPGTRHRLLSRRAFSLSTLYLQPSAAALPLRSQVVAVDPLFRELLAEVGRFGPGLPPEGPPARLMQVLLDRLPVEPLRSLFLPFPRDPRAARIGRILDENPADARSLDLLAAEAGLSGRTAQRLFQRETGISFGRWRQALRLMSAVDRLAGGDDVTRAALASGYQDVSTFIERFKEIWGQTPGRFLPWLRQAGQSWKQEPGD